MREVPTEVLDEQVARLLDSAAPNRESTTRILAALARPVVGPDRLAIARLDARLKSLGTEIAALAPERGMADILSEIDATRRERERLAAQPKQDVLVNPEDALAWLASLGTRWRDTSDESRRRLALATFERINVISSPTRASHRIVSIEMTEEAERRGLVLALSASLEVTMVGDTGFEPVTSRM